MSKRTETIVLSIFCVAVVLMGLVILYVSTNSFKTKPNAMYLQIGDKKYTGDNEQLTIGNARVAVKYPFNSKKDFTYKIEPVGEDFTYKVDGKEMSYLQLKELTNVLVVNANEDSLTLECLDKSLSTILQTLYWGQAVDVPTGIDDEYHFKLVVASTDGKTSVSLTFRCLVLPQDITFDKPSIVF